MFLYFFKGFFRRAWFPTRPCNGPPPPSCMQRAFRRLSLVFLPIQDSQHDAPSGMPPPPVQPHPIEVGIDLLATLCVPTACHAPGHLPQVLGPMDVCGCNAGSSTRPWMLMWVALHAPRPIDVNGGGVACPQING